MSDFWDSRFGDTEYVYGKQPNVFFAEQTSGLKPGKLLLPAEGEGRNAVFAAGLGWDVDAFDSSIEGRKKAMLLAEEMGVQLEYAISSYQTYEPEEQEYDLIALIYAHMPSELRKEFHKKIQNWLAPGGRIIIEVFHKSQLGNSSGGPKDLDLLYDLSDLNNDFKGMEIIQSEVVTDHLAEGNYHKGQARLVRFVARKL